MNDTPVEPSDKPPSLSPQAKANKVWADAAENIAVIGAACFFFYVGKLDKYEWGTICGACSVGATFLRGRGKPAGMFSNAIALISGKWAAVAAVGRHISIIALAFTLMHCAAFGKVVRSIDVVAKDLCEIWAADQGQAKLGLSPEDFCALAKNREPFTLAARNAYQSAGGEATARLHAR